MDRLDQVAAMLMDKETIDADEFAAIMSGENPAAGTAD